MNNIRRDEIDKIKRRRKRKSNKLLIFTKPSKALIAFNRHIEAAQSDIEKSRLQYCNDAINNQNANRKKTKLTMGIFDNAVCSKNIKKILQPSMTNKNLGMRCPNNLFKLPIVNQKLEKEIDKELSINETLQELAEKCREQLNIRHCSRLDEWISNTAGMMRLRAAKAEACRNNRLELIDCDAQIGSQFVGRVSEPSLNLMESKQSREKQAQPSLSASTSISNCRISFPPPAGGASPSCAARTRKSNIDTSCEASHPLWDTPEELRTSRLGAFSERSFFGDTQSLISDSRTGASLWVPERAGNKLLLNGNLF